MNRRDNQRGGIVVFAVVGVLLVGLLAGVLYVSKQRSEVAKQNAPKPIAIDTEKEATTTNKDKQQSETKPSQSQQNTPATPPQSSSGNTSSTSTTRANTPNSTAAPANVAQSGPSAMVPATGPSDVAIPAIVTSVVTFVAVVFYRSSLQLRRSALGR